MLKVSPILQGNQTKDFLGEYKPNLHFAKLLLYLNFCTDKGMVKPRKNEPLRASVLDRLRHRQSGAHRDGVPLRQLREALRRDLEDLLNTRRCCASWSDELNELGYSLVHYGLKDFSGSSFGSPEEQEQFRQDIEQAIAQYEPRLAHVVVQLPRTDPRDRTLRFRIEAVLNVWPASEAVPVVFDSSLQPLTATFEVEGRE